MNFSNLIEVEGVKKKRRKTNRRGDQLSVNPILSGPNPVPQEASPGEDPPTEFLCVCRNHLSIRRIRLIWRLGIFRNPHRGPYYEP